MLIKLSLFLNRTSFETIFNLAEPFMRTAIFVKRVRKAGEYLRLTACVKPWFGFDLL